MKKAVLSSSEWRPSTDEVKSHTPSVTKIRSCGEWSFLSKRALQRDLTAKYPEMMTCLGKCFF